MHARVDDLELYLRDRLPERRAAATGSHVADCPVRGENLDRTPGFIEDFAELSRLQAAQPSPAERRRNQRIPTNDPALIKLIHPTVSEPLAARILDVSKDGLKVEMALLLEPGTTIEIRMRNLVAIAEVRYCAQVGEVCHAGVSIQDVFADSDGDGAGVEPIVA